MRFVNSSYEIIDQESNVLGIYKQIEKAARTSYKSEDRITEDSAKKMVDTLIKNKHYACLEHGTIYLEIPDDVWVAVCGDYENNPYSKVVHVTSNPTKDGGFKTIQHFITTNARVIVENGWQNDLQYVCEPTEFHERRVTVKFTCDIGVGREITRHRVFSFMQESTRYCNYSKDKFGRQVTYIIPSWSVIQPGEYKSPLDVIQTVGKDLTFAHSCYNGEYFYFDMLDDGATPQEARQVLPLSVKTDLVMTGFVSDWKHFFALRSHIAATGKPHPDLQVLADALLEDFKNRQYITDEEISHLE